MTHETACMRPSTQYAVAPPSPTPSPVPSDSFSISAPLCENTGPNSIPTPSGTSTPNSIMTQQRHQIKHEDLVEYKAVAGHDGTMANADGTLFIKPCTAAELAFYNSCQAPEYEDFRNLMPAFMGSLELRNDLKQEATKLVNQASQPTSLAPQTAAMTPPSSASAQLSPSLQPKTSTTTDIPDIKEPLPTSGAPTAELSTPASAVDHSVSNSAACSTVGSIDATSAPDSPKTDTWIPNGSQKIKTNLAVVLENTTHGFSRPNILDCKLGTRLWADDAPTQKKKRFTEVAQRTTHKNFGFRIAGMRVWKGSENEEDLDENGYKVYDRNYGRDCVTDDTLASSIRKFVFNEKAGVTQDLALAMCQVFVNELDTVLEVMKRHPLRMYSGSLLFIFEGDGNELRRKITEHNKMIELLDGESDDDGDEEIDLQAIMQAATAKETGVVSGSPVMLNGQSVQIINQSAADFEDSEINFNQEEDEEFLAPVPAPYSLRLIDFAHAKWVSAEEGTDPGLLLGVESLRNIFQGFLDEDTEKSKRNKEGLEEPKPKKQRTG